MKDFEFVENVKLAASKPSAYMWGTFGMQISEGLIAQKAKQYPSRYSSERKKFLNSLSGDGYWGWDCAGLIKGILWGWSADDMFPYGGGSYASNGVPDTNVNGLESSCADLSSDFTKIVPGELLFMPDHVGVYVGDGMVVEATLWNGFDGVVLTRLAGRGWVRHGKLKFIEYSEVKKEKNLYIHVNSIGLYVREKLSFNSSKRAIGKIVGFCPVGGEMQLVEFVPGIQPDGYQWVKTKYNGVSGFSQYDSKCYYIFEK